MSLAVDPLLAALGLSKTDEIPEGLQELLADHLEIFLVGGGRFSWPEFLTMSDDARAALAIAGWRVQHALGEAIADSLSARLEGSLRQSELDTAAEEALKKIGGKS